MRSPRARERRILYVLGGGGGRWRWAPPPPSGAPSAQSNKIVSQCVEKSKRGKRVHRNQKRMLNLFYSHRTPHPPHKLTASKEDGGGGMQFYFPFPKRNRSVADIRPQKKACGRDLDAEQEKRFPPHTRVLFLGILADVRLLERDAHLKKRMERREVSPILFFFQAPRPAPLPPRFRDLENGGVVEWRGENTAFVWWAFAISQFLREVAIASMPKNPPNLENGSGGKEGWGRGGNVSAEYLQL